MKIFSKVALFSILSISTIYANSLTIASKGTTIASKGSLLEKPLLAIKVSDLSKFSMVDNLSDLKTIALNNQKISYSEINLIEKFKDIKNGDEILLKCLQSSLCKVEDSLKIVNSSELHKTIFLKYPDLSLQQINLRLGEFNEKLMNNYYKNSGWRQIQGEIGRTGIDGLFIKKNSDGVVVDVLMTESKYNTSQLATTNSGKQMSFEWITNNIEKLIKKYPENTEYQQVLKHIENNNYRARLWNLKQADNVLEVNLTKLNQKGDKVPFDRGEQSNINFKDNNIFDLTSPKNEFQKRFIEFYQETLKNI